MPQNLHQCFPYIGVSVVPATISTLTPYPPRGTEVHPPVDKILWETNSYLYTCYYSSQPPNFELLLELSSFSLFLFFLFKKNGHVCFIYIVLHIFYQSYFKICHIFLHSFIHSLTLSVYHSQLIYICSQLISLPLLTLKLAKLNLQSPNLPLQFQSMRSLKVKAQNNSCLSQHLFSGSKINVATPAKFICITFFKIFCLVLWNF